MFRIGGILKPLSSALTSRRFSRIFSSSYVSGNSSVKPSVLHPTAVVHPDAMIGQDVSIGPFCTVGPSAKLGDGCQLYPGSHIFGDTELGERCVLMTGAVVGDDLPGRTVIGCNNIIGYHAVVGVKCQDMKYKPVDECFLDVGDNNEIREHTSIHRSSKSSERTVIGDNNLIMGSCHIAHDCKLGNNNIFANNTLLAGHVVVEDYAHTAGAVVVHQFCRIGSFAFIGGGSVLSQDVPRYMMVSGERAELRGLNLEGLRRRGFSVTEIKSLRTAYRKIFMPVDANAGSFEERLAEVEQHDELAHVPVVSSMVQSIRDSFTENARGICRFRHWTGSCNAGEEVSSLRLSEGTQFGDCDKSHRLIFMTQIPHARHNVLRKVDDLELSPMNSPYTSSFVQRFQHSGYFNPTVPEVSQKSMFSSYGGSHL